MWVYAFNSRSKLFEVGFYVYGAEIFWTKISEFEFEELAMERVHFLNGGN